MNTFKMAIVVAFTLYSSSVLAQLRVVTTTTDLNWLVKQIGGERVTSESLLGPNADPHFVDAMPHFIHKVANADLVCSVGLDLEVGWLPKVLARSGNRHVQPGGKGFCEMGQVVKALDVISGKVDRSMGDVHPSGNPHFHLGPSRLLQAAGLVYEKLVALDPSGSSYYSTQRKKLENKMQKLKAEVREQIANFINKHPDFKVVEYHKEFTYFLSEFGIQSQGAIEEKPGVAPSAGRLARIAIEAKRGKVKVALATLHSPKDLLKKFTEISAIPHRAVPLSVRGPGGDFNSYAKLIKDVADAIVKN